MFWRRPRRQSMLILKGERMSKKRDFFVNIFQNVSKNAFFGCFFFQKFAYGVENFVFIWTGSARKINC